MRSPRFGIGWLMALVAIAAFNYLPYRACYYTYWTNDAAWSNQLDVLFVGAAPMANLLIVGFLVALRRREYRPFLYGFEAVGFVAWAIYIILVAFYCHSLVRPYLFRLQVPVFNALGRGKAQIPIFMFTSAVILGWWQIASVLIGGFLSRNKWYKTSQP